MSRFRLAGPGIGDDLGMVSVTISGATRTTPVNFFQLPLAVSGLPRISDGFESDTLSLDETGLAGITARDWRVTGGASLGSGATLPGTGLGGQWIECAVTHSGGTSVSPPVMVCAGGMMASHDADDADIIGITPHADATHIAVGDGRWSDPATWLNADLPGKGACVLIPHGRTVTYDSEEPNVRLDRVRVDGTLTWALDRSTTMLVETLTGTRGSQIIIGTKAARLPAEFSAEIIISGRDYSLKASTETDMELAKSARMWGRGIITQGLCRIWGTAKTTWDHAEEIPAGSTSLTLRNTPTGIVAGDTVIIGGTGSDYTYTPGTDHAMDYQDEERVLTAVSGKTLTWSGGLVHDHKNQLAGSTRTDLYPVVMVRGGKNVRFRSEVTGVRWRRGHFACVHHHSEVDIWDLDVTGMGRTGKDRPAGILSDDLSEVEFRAANANAYTSTTTTNDNIQSRYSIHLHHVGFEHTGPRPVVANCYVEDAPGHAIVHHACDADLVDNAMYRFFGCGMVSESGNELGSWVGNCALGTSYTGDFNIEGEPKNLEDLSGREGDNFRHGYGFGFRGRAMRTNRNVAVSCTYGHVFFHRQGNGTGTGVVAPLDLQRSFLDLQDAGRAQAKSWAAFRYEDYPIIHFADNEAIACYGGLFVSKSLPLQNHDVSVKLKRFRSWGFVKYGASVEYVGPYIFEDFDTVAGRAGVGNGSGFGSNVHHSFMTAPRSEGARNGLNFGGLDTLGVHDNYDEVTDPRWGQSGADVVDCFNNKSVSSSDGAVKSGFDVHYENDDWDDTALDYTADPTENFPLVMGSWNGSSISSNAATNAQGSKSDNLGNAAKIAPKVDGDTVFAEQSYNLTTWRGARGFWTRGGDDVLVVPYIITDRLTGRPAKVTKLYRITASRSGTNNGAFTYAGTPVTQSDKSVPVAQDGTVVVDVLTGAGGAGGAGTYSLDTRDYIAPDHGVAELDGATGEVTYTPDAGYAGTDEMFVFIESQGRYKTVRISFLTGPGGAVSTPVAGTDFTVADHAEAQIIAVALSDKPACGGRRIRLVQYSTDGGTTWRRLCNGWIRAVHKVTTTSDGSDITAGSYDLRIRYRTNYDQSTSGASADVAVSIT